MLTLSELIIEIDYREKRRETTKGTTVPEELEKLIKDKKLNIKVEYKTLDIGDYKIIKVVDSIVIAVVVVEHKSPKDFIKSKFNFHLNNQMFEQSRDLPISYLLVDSMDEETTLYDEVVKLGYPDPDYWLKCAFIGTSFKRSDQGQKGWVCPIRTYDKKDTARWLTVLCDKVEAGEFLRFPEIEREGKFKPTTNEWLVFIVSSFQGVGNIRAVELLKKHKTLRALMTSTDWTCKGVGEKTNTVIQQILDSEFTV